IKGVGEGPIEAIVEARNSGGYFKNIFELCARTDMKRINRRVLEKLTMAGAFDKLGPPDHYDLLSYLLEPSLSQSS
ncbi:hypothetical protein GASC598P17_000120, partial [Gilliamella apis SCGC AB-598-P17]